MPNTPLSGAMLIAERRAARSRSCASRIGASLAAEHVTLRSAASSAAAATSIRSA